ncbi:rho GTPase-activating protein gacK isoform X2 [Sitophilus oryzae]|uniref:Rho GTPase-activating protein gacK isoform X2 n=1 Tax=Sitophilus oryzae TaxID=7048 RepID=A0A6J2XCP9_SITOR|nr:rho GTPase-activating protein gacK isoform X2 [Sitophilus oryzae]
MTHYWWMHWFWITFCLCEFVFVAFGHTLLTTLHSTPTTENVTPTVEDVSHTDTAGTNATSNPPKAVTSLVVKNSSTYPKSMKPWQFSKKLNILPLQPPNESNLNNINNQNKTDVAVINQNLTDSNLNVNATGYIFNNNTNMSSTNQTGNSTYLEEEVNFNHSYVHSDSIDIEEKEIDLDTSTGNLSAAGITGITLGCIIVVGMICGVSFFIYQNQGFNRPQVLNDRCSNPDSSGYIDDASDNSEEMYSLDNDSFLNSLEAMTIQNYWTDVKHTKL